MLIERVFTPGLAQVAYLVADEPAREVAVIDPRRDVDEYVDWADGRGFRIVAILETHVHADFVSGAPELAARTGAPVYASRLGESEFPHVPLDDGALIPVGELRLQAFWTPGHTPEHMSFLLRPPSAAAPVAMFSGDLLFVGEVGRPDLLGKRHTQELAGELYETIHHRLASIGDDLVVYPGHTAGSSCGRKIGDAPNTTMGEQRLSNYAFRPQTREQFIESVLANMPPPPTYYPVLKKINKGGAASAGSLAGAAPLAPREVRRLQADGALLLDTRDPQAFTRGFIPGSRFAGLGPDFTAWTGWMAPYDRPLVLVVDGPEALEDAITNLRRIGLDNVAGYVDGGVAGWRSAGLPLHSIEEIDVLALASQMNEPGFAVLDVRSEDEYQAGHIPKARHA
ncbi:MAG TPA: rhodanese-like domain-containing protein, partial [Thermomicrobiales bacterium]|nr:rhodanese-like domain-containing protein [Thermomicrobiales bacterium]